MKIFKSFLGFALVTTFLLACAPSESEIKEAKIHYDMGLLYFQEGDNIRALQELVKAKEKHSGDKHIWNALGLTYKERKLYNEAEDAFKQAIELDSKFSEAYNNLGVLYLDLKRYKDAIVAFEKAAKNIFYTTPELAYNNMGYAYQMLGDMAAAERNFKEAISLNPSFSLSYTNLANLYIYQKRYQEAEAVLLKFLSVFENHLEANFVLGKLYKEIGETEKATIYFNKIIKIDSRSYWANQAKIYMAK